jgi:hypothetical protein
LLTHPARSTTPVSRSIPKMRRENLLAMLD